MAVEIMTFLIKPFVQFNLSDLFDSLSVSNEFNEIVALST